MPQYYRGIEQSAAIEFTDYELQKAFAGISSHEQPLLVPIFANDQDMPRLAQKVQTWLDNHPDCQGYLIRGHGLYTWARPWPMRFDKLKPSSFY